MISPTTLAASPPAAPFQLTKKMLEPLALLPATAVQLLNLLDDPDASLRKIAEVAGRDVGITAAVLRMANSPVLGMRGRVGTIEEGLRLIGTGQARLLVLSCGVAQAGKKELSVYGLPSGTFLRHGELVATLTMFIASQARFSQIGVAYCAGLLHDVGKVVINGLALQAAPTRPWFQQFTEALHDPSATLRSVEQRGFGADHVTVGRDLAALWSLPTEIADAIFQHHDVWDAGASSLSSFVALANAVASVVDPSYPELNRVPLPEHPLCDLEPLITMATDLVTRESH